MQERWRQIAPDHPHDPHWWLGYLRRTYGAEIPLTVFTQFAEDGHTLAQLEHPQFYRAWFETQCSERGRRHPASGASAWLRRRLQQEAADRTGPTRRTPVPDAAPGPVPLGEVLAGTTVLPARAPENQHPVPIPSAEAPASLPPHEGRPANPSAEAAPRRSPLTAERPQPSQAARSRPPSLAAYRQDLQAIYQATRERAWPSPNAAGSRRGARSRRPATAMLPPATGPPVPDLPDLPVAV